MTMQVRPRRSLAHLGAVVVLSGFLITLAGCWNALELDERALVVGVGLDHSRLPGQVDLSLQILKPAAAVSGGRGRGGGGGSEEKAVWVVTASGRTPFEAVRNASRLTGRKLFWGHIEAIIVHETLAREGITRLLDPFIRDHESRQLAWLLIAKGIRAKEILTAGAEMERIPAEAIRDQLKSYGATSTIMPMDIHRFMTDLAAPGKSPVAPGIELASAGEKAEPKGGSEGESKLVKVTGTAVFRGDRLVGWLDEKESRGLLWVLNQVKSGSLVVRCPADERERVGLEIMRAKSKLGLQIQRGRPVVTVEVTEVGNIADQTGRTNLTNVAYFRSLERRKAAVIRDEVQAALAKAQKRLRSDIFGFGLAMSRKFPTEWRNMELNWHDQFFPDLQVRVEVHATLRDTGTTAGPALIR